MDLLLEKQVTAEERNQINDQIREDLVEHLYKSNNTAIATGFLTSVAVFIFYYNAVPLLPLLIWFVAFTLALLFIAAITIGYRKYRYKTDTRTWELLLCSVIVVCSILWGATTVLFLYTDLTHQYIQFAILLMLASAYSMGTVGETVLGIVTITAMLAPIVIWTFAQGGFYHSLAGAFLIFYYLWLIGMNRRSTDWLINSLRLKIENSFFTHQANHDLLTDLPNHRMLIRYLELYVRSFKASKESFAIICFGVNRLEMFNNSLGYQAGDLIIQSLAKRIKTVFDQKSLKDDKTRIITLPRPDSFTFVIEPLKLTEVAEEIRDIFSILDTPFHLGQREAKLTASIGVSLFPTDGENARILLSNAYASMFQARQQGGNAVEYYKREINEKTPVMLELESEMHHALINHEFEVYYQPIIDIIENKVAGMEALIRWNHPKRGMVPPNDFIPLAAETGLILPIGEWVMEQSCKQTVEWLKSGLALQELKVSVNLSVKQLRQGNLLEIVENILEKTGLDAHNLDLELTETEMLDEKLAPLIRDLTSRGVSLSIDDFGTGYSGLSYLKFFKVDKIKIDQSFIRDVTTNVDSSTIVSAILAMGKEMGIKTLAEGVETVEQLNFLKERTCRYVQGYYFSKPVPAAQFKEFLKNFGARESKSAAG